MEIALTGMAGHIVEDESKGFALEIWTVRIGYKIQVHLRLLEDNLLDAELLAIDTERNNPDQFFGDFRNLSETVCQALTIGGKGVVEMITAGEAVEFAIEQHAL